MREERYFFKEHFHENDNSVEEFKKELKQYIENALKANLVAMSDHALFLYGGEQALRELLSEL
jgi:cytosine/adenosine deaminase-related metal-dependent hydrolase